MAYQVPFCLAKKFRQGQRTFAAYLAFYSLFSIFAPSMITPFLHFAQGQVLPASGGWATTYGGYNNDWAEHIQQTSDGGYIVAGETRSFGVGSMDLWVLKLRPDGAVEWQKTYGGVDWDWANSIQQTSDGGYIVAGWTRSFGAGDHDIWVLKLKPDGAVEWQKAYGGIGIDVAHSIQQTSDGGYIVTGWTKSFGAGDHDIWVLKLKPDGTVEWQKTYGGG